MYQGSLPSSSQVSDNVLVPDSGDSRPACHDCGVLSSPTPTAHAHRCRTRMSLLNHLTVVNQFSSVFQSCPTLQPHGLQHARLPCTSLYAGACSNSCPLSQWRHPTISSSVVPFSSCPQSFPASESFPMSQLFTSDDQSIGVSASASVLPMNIWDWFPLGWTDWISLQSKGLSRVFSNTTVQKHEFFSAQLSSQSNSHIHTWLLEKP